LLYLSTSLIAAAPSLPMLLPSSLCSRGSIKQVRVPRAPKRRRGNWLSPHAHCSHVRILLCFSASPITAAPAPPMLFLLRLCSREVIEQVRVPRAPERRRLVPHTHCSDVRILLCFSASPIAVAPLSPTLFLRRLCGKKKHRLGRPGPVERKSVHGLFAHSH
jgi:hypothetical protein